MNQLQILYEKLYFPGSIKLYKAAKEQGMEVKYKTVKEFVDSQKVSQLFRNKVASSGHIVAFSPWSFFQMDLANMKQYSRKNKGYKWMLMVVDVFTRFAWVKPLKSKRPVDVAVGLGEVLMEKVPNLILTDNGSEYKGQVKQLLNTMNITHETNDLHDHKALGIIDRFTRTLREKVNKVFFVNNSTNWIDHIQDIIKVYNNTPHGGIELIKPKDAHKKPYIWIITELNLKKAKKNKTNQKHDIRVGDVVRTRIKRKLFDKGTLAKWSNDTHNVTKVDGRHVWVNGRRYVQDNVLKVKHHDEQIERNAQEVALEQNRARNRIARAGVDAANALPGRRRRRAVDHGAFINVD